MILFIAVVILLGVFNPWTGLFGNTLYSPKRPSKEVNSSAQHKSFRLTKERL